MLYRSGTNGGVPLAEREVRRMVAAQRHRGPDGEGVFAGEGVALGHCRLSIIDLSQAGHQPMSDRSGRFWITFNGEIYNYVELRNELSRVGCKFRGHSDTEVLLNSYLQWGAQCVSRLRGMFAFAVWDDQERTLFAARDRLGIKPFHYICTDDWFGFASEIKALVPLLSKPAPNRKLARAYLAWNLLEHEPAETMIEGIQRLPAGHTLSLSLEPAAFKVAPYWSIRFCNDLDTPAAERPAKVQEFRDLFQQTIALHLRSDVPVGTALSGGLDSSSIVCLVQQELQRRGHWREAWQHTFSACFDKPSLDERPYIREVVKSTGCTPHFTFPTGERLRADLERWLWHQEEPVAGTAPYAHFCVARLASEHQIKVLLDGQGADEQLAGYRKFILSYLRQLLETGRYVRGMREAAAFFLSPAILLTSDFTAGKRYLFKSQPEFTELFPDGVEYPPDLGIGPSLGRRLEADLLRFSLPLLLRYEDRNTMAFGIEARVPFVDHVLVEYLATLAADMRLSGGWTKRILREGLQDVLPERVRRRKTKLGFSTPERSWLAGPLAGWIRETLQSQMFLGEIVDKDRLQKLLRVSFHGTLMNPSLNSSCLGLLFRLAIFETWARLYLVGSTQSASLRRGLQPLGRTSVCTCS
jgi:asparagine synthase (glutamine-hydrolysing)